MAGVLRHLIDMKLMYLPVILGKVATCFLSFLHFVDEKIRQISVACAERLGLAES